MKTLRMLMNLTVLCSRKKASRWRLEIFVNENYYHSQDDDHDEDNNLDIDHSHDQHEDVDIKYEGNMCVFT